MSSVSHANSGFSPEVPPQAGDAAEGLYPPLRLVGPEERGATAVADTVAVEPVQTEIDPVTRLPKIFVPLHLRDRTWNADGSVTIGDAYRVGTVPIPAQVPTHLAPRVVRSDGSTSFVVTNR